MKKLKLALAAAIVAATGAAYANPAEHNSIDWQQVSAPVDLKMPKATWLSAHMATHNGVPSLSGSANRTVRIDPDTRWVNVTQNEVIRFVAGDRAFDWRFATHSLTPVELSKIAPPGFAPNVDPTIYIAPDPLYSGS